jgi:transcriptional regulator with XRE-family HTH domain
MATSSILQPNPDQPPAQPKNRAALRALPEPTSDIKVDGEAAERIKHLRLRKSMGLVELGRHTGLSASFLSQLETGRVVPTLRNLARIAMVFSKDLNYFFEPEPLTLFRIHRCKDRVRLPQSGVADPAYYFESLGYLVPDRQLDPYFAEFLPVKSGQEPRSHQHFGCEFLFVLSGSLTIRHGSIAHQVEEGDAIYFDAATIHSYECCGPNPASALIVTLQQPVSANGSTNRGSQLSNQPVRNPRSLPAAPPQRVAGKSQGVPSAG